MLREEVIQQIRIGRIKHAQDEKGWVANVKEYLVVDVTQMGVKMRGRVLG